MDANRQQQKRVLRFAKFAKFSFKKVTPAFEQMNFVHNENEQSEQNAEQTKFQFQQPVDFFQFLKFFKVLLHSQNFIYIFYKMQKKTISQINF